MGHNCVMTEGTMTRSLADPSYDGHKSGSGVRAGRGVDVRVREVRRRIWPTEERLGIVRETLEPGAIVQAVADRHGISTGQLYTWRKQMLATAMSGFVPVELVPQTPSVLTTTPAISTPPGMIEIVLPSGASIRVSGCADEAVLRVVLTEMAGR